MVRLGWARSPQSIEVLFGTSRGGAIDSVVPAHREVDWEQLRTVGKGQRSPLATLAKHAVLA